MKNQQNKVYLENKKSKVFEKISVEFKLMKVTSVVCVSNVGMVLVIKLLCVYLIFLQLHNINLRNFI